MREKAFFFLFLALMCGCASHKDSATATPPTPLGNPTFSGRTPSAFGKDAETVWQERLANPIGGLENRGIVRAVREGVARISTDGGDKWKEAKVGMAFGGNSEIHTDSGATTDVFLGDNGPVVRITKDSEVRFVRLTVQNTGTEKTIDTMIELHRGRMLGNVKKLSAASSYLIRTQGGVIQIRGTEFSVEADCSLTIVSGVGVVYFRGKTYEVKQGEKFVPGVGKETER